MELTESQEKIIQQRNKNILVSASAGSGKTFVVIERILDRILKDKISAENLLVVTFTNAAASELKERLTQKLYTVLDAMSREENRAYILSQIRRIQVANISTIHAFCLNIIKDNFYNIGVDPGVKITDEASSNIMILDSITETLEEEYAKQEETFIETLRLFKSEEGLIQILNDTYKYYLSMPDRNSWMTNAQMQYDITDIKDLGEISLGQDIINAVYEKVDIMQIELKKVIDKLEGLEDFKTRKDVLCTILSKISKIKEKNTYNNIYAYVQNIDLSDRLPSSKVSDENLKEEIKNVKALTARYVKDIEKLVYKDTDGIKEELHSMIGIVNLLLNIIQSIHEKYDKKKKEKAVIDFTDIEYLAYTALQDENIAKQYTEKFEEIYIDEYQDTSLVQEEIISKIKRYNNVVMVGDVKQSIYGFRHAMPEIFVNKYLDFPTDDIDGNNNLRIMLGKNFRSSKYVIDTVNTVFSNSMTEKCGGIDYTKDEYLICGIESEPNEELASELNIVQTEVEIQDNETEEDDVIQELTNIQKETTLVAKRIKELVSSGIEIADNITKQKRACTYKDIVILLRSTSNVANVVEEGLKTAGIPVYSDAGDGFFKTEEINLVISFLKILNNIYDDIPLVSVLYSIIGNFTLDELTEIRIIDKNSYMIQSMYKYLEQGQNEDIKKKIKVLLTLVDKIKKYINVYSLAETVIYIVDNCDIYSAMSLEENTNIKCANLDAFIDIVSNYENKEGKSLISFLTYIDNLSKKGGSKDSPKVMGENENVVRIMTIHKSKGLEFPVVILMNANKKFNEKDMQKEIQLDDKYGMGINIYNKELEITYPSVIKQAIKQKIKNKNIAEEQRLLYVALTRAKYKLLVYGTVADYAKFESGLKMSEESIKLSHADVVSSNTYLKLLLKVCSLPNVKLPFNINVYDFENNKPIDKLEKNLDIRKQSYKNKIETLAKNKNLKIDEKYMDELTSLYDFQYEYSGAKNVEQKYTATELKAKATDEKQSVLMGLKPNAILDNVSQTSYGTFIHKVIELIDITNISKQNILDNVQNVLASMDEAENINAQIATNKIYKMLTGSMGELLKNDKEVHREYNFVIEDDLKSIPDLALAEKTLIQGVIDMYIIMNSGDKIIIDYKTDNIETREELVEKYKYQLYVYKRAIEIATGEEVKSMYIYSFHLNELIEVK